MLRPSKTVESELKRTDGVELVTTPPDVETHFNTYEPLDVEYDTDTEDISQASAVTNRYPQANPNCDADDFLTDCPGNPNIKLCNKQFCDHISNCPNGEDESAEQCQVGE